MLWDISKILGEKEFTCEKAHKLQNTNQISNYLLKFITNSF